MDKQFANSENINQKIVLENIQSRKSVRHFVKNKEMSQENIEKILRAAMSAPSALNMQPWEFVVVTDKTILNTLADECPYGKMLADAACAIVVAGNIEFAGGVNQFWSQDASAATQNILLAVESLGLGAVWIGGYPKEDRMKIIIETLALPQNILPLNIIAIGYPTGEDVAKDKWNPAKIHYNKY